MPEISRHSYDIAVVAVRRDHISCVSVLKVYRPWVAFLSSSKNSENRTIQFFELLMDNKNATYLSS